MDCARSVNNFGEPAIERLPRRAASGQVGLGGVVGRLTHRALVEILPAGPVGSDFGRSAISVRISPAVALDWSATTDPEKRRGSGSSWRHSRAD